MEVNTKKVNHIEGKSHSPKRDVLGNSSTSPRFGEQYQAELPPLISKSMYKRLQKKNSNHAEGSYGFQVGLPIPLIWIEEVKTNVDEEPKDVNESIKSTDVTDKTKSSKQKCTKESQNRFVYENSNPNSKAAAESALTEGTELGESGNSNVHEEMEAEANKEHKGKGYCLVPGFSTNTWTETEEASLTLGLYIFGKNLVQVKRFLENKEMGDILSFYHGKFYGSDGHRRWSECKHMKGRKCIYGSKIFTGPRQQKLLSRLLPNMPDECRKADLLQVLKSFSEREIHLEDLVRALKVLVGLKSLVEAVGIGKGKQDLTGPTADPLKSNQAPPACPQLSRDKSFEMLTSKEITNYLTGNFRISKSRSSEIFWEGVWPRLLDRGWHSEVPPGRQSCIISSKDLFFFVPGVDKFSRNLVKGNHYFDSHTEVLSKVILEPELIEHVPKAKNDHRNEEENGGTATKSPQESSPDKQGSSCLMPQIQNCGLDVIKFTVVDTSLTGEKSTNLRELKSLPDGIVETPILVSDSEVVQVNEPSMTKTIEGQQNYPRIEHFMIEIAEGQQNNTRKEPVVTETVEGQQNDTMKESGDLGAGTSSQAVVKSQPDSTQRRSTRSRAMTTKALEAFAFDYPERNEMRKRKDSSRDGARSRSSQRARVKRIGEASGSN